MKCYTDGSAFHKTGEGGCAAVFVDETGYVTDIFRKKLENTKTGRAEINALILALESAIELKIDNLIIYSDSKYVINTIKEGWYSRWVITNDKSKANLDLWAEVFKLLPKIKSFDIKHVKGHNGNLYNELADYYSSYKYIEAKPESFCNKPNGNCSRNKAGECKSKKDCKHKNKYNL